MGDDVACSHKWSLTQAGTKVIKLPQSFLTGHTTLITQSTLGQRSSSPQKKTFRSSSYDQNVPKSK